jgi:hypothetical protein
LGDRLADELDGPIRLPGRPDDPIPSVHRVNGDLEVVIRSELAYPLAEGLPAHARTGSEVAGAGAISGQEEQDLEVPRAQRAEASPVDTRCDVATDPIEQPIEQDDKAVRIPF